MIAVKILKVIVNLMELTLVIISCSFRITNISKTSQKLKEHLVYLSKSPDPDETVKFVC